MAFQRWGGAIILRLEVQRLLRATRAEKFWGLYPTYDILEGYNSCKETYGEPIGQRFQGYACYNMVMHL